jgi:hypothetical protein
MTDIDPDTLDVLESVLRDSHVGEQNAVTSDELGTALNESDAHDTNPSIRDAVRQLVNDRQVPVCSSTRGYWIPEDSDGIDEEIKSIRDRIGALNERIINLRTARDEFDFDETIVDSDDGNGTDQPDAMSADGTKQETDEQTTVCDGPQCSVDVPRSDWRYVDGRDSPVCPRCYGRWLMDGKSLESVATDGGESR